MVPLKVTVLLFSQTTNYFLAAREKRGCRPLYHIFKPRELHRFSKRMRKCPFHIDVRWLVIVVVVVVVVVVSVVVPYKSSSGVHSNEQLSRS